MCWLQMYVNFVPRESSESSDEYGCEKSKFRSHGLQAHHSPVPLIRLPDSIQFIISVFKALRTGAYTVGNRYKVIPVVAANMTTRKAR